MGVDSEKLEVTDGAVYARGILWAVQKLRLPRGLIHVSNTNYLFMMNAL
jgi:hypothetical protein